METGLTGLASTTRIGQCDDGMANNGTAKDDGTANVNGKTARPTT